MNESSNLQKNKVVFIAGGGTGGHIYPGIAIAKCLQNLSNVDVHFVGTREGLETKIVPKEGFVLHLIQGGKLNMAGHTWTKVKTLLKLPVGFLQAIGLILKYKPIAILGVGGYASAPVVLMAAIFNRIGIYKGQTAIWEPNAHPGLANRWLSKVVDNCFVVFEESKKYLNSKNIMVLGMPVRAEIEKAFMRTHVVAEATQLKKTFRILHFGGSQGARAIGQALSDAVLLGGPWLQGTQIVHQSGSLDYAKLKQKYNSQNLTAVQNSNNESHLNKAITEDQNVTADSGLKEKLLTNKSSNEPSVELLEFIYDMPKYYESCDLVICRGGASTIAELAAYGLPAIVIPLPMADGHQEQNAKALADVDALLMLLQKDLTPQRLIAEIENLRHHPEQLQKYSKNIKSFFKPKAVEQISHQLLRL